MNGMFVYKKSTNRKSCSLQFVLKYYIENLVAKSLIKIFRTHHREEQYILYGMLVG